MPTPSCGQEISQDTTLDSDLTCPSGPALTIVADNVVLDLGGHTVSGNPTANSSGPGILLKNVRGTTVRNGTVQHFSAGVVIDGGGGNLVQNVTAQDNFDTSGGDLGDGIVVTNSSENRIEGNTAQRNGPYSGISLVQESQRNRIRNNIVADNNMMALGDPSAGREDMGIRVEGPGANDNRVENNTVTGSGRHGISILCTCVNRASTPPCVGSPGNERNHIAFNTVMHNGTSGGGDGINLFSMGQAVSPTDNVIADNVAHNNATNGIGFHAPGTDIVGANYNKALRNSAHGNAQDDGFDGNTKPPCAFNVWEDNDFGTVNQPGVEHHEESSEARPETPKPTASPQDQQGRFRIA